MEEIKRILIVGDSGRGKSTLAEKLSNKLEIKHFSTDDYFWKIKFTLAEDKQTSIRNISRIYDNESWIVEGSTRSLIREGIEKSDQIIYLVYPNIISQFWTLFKRKLSRKEERWSDLLGLYAHLLRKRFKIGAQKDKIGLEEMLQPFSHKIVRLSSFKDIDSFVNKK